MKILVTGHDGYIGTVLVPVLRAAGHEVHGLDSELFGSCLLGEPPEAVPSLAIDVRDVEPEHLDGFDAVCHLAAISNDPLGDLNPECTYDINWRATVRLGEVAKEAGVGRFVFSSSCSLYGAQGDAPIDEHADFNPVTPYGTSKVRSEQGLHALADATFSPVYLRNATAYGYSPRLRGDLVVNNLTGFAFTTGEVFMKSDGTPWRPLVHIEDISRAFLAVLEAPVEAVHDEAFNVGATAENYQICDVAAIVEEVVPNSRVVLAEAAGPDLRNYRVDCDKIAHRLGFSCKWTVRAGAEELYGAFKRHGLTLDDLEGSKFLRLKRVRELLDSQQLDESLRWRVPVDVAGGEA